MNIKRTKKIKIIFISVLCAVLSVPLIVMPTVTVIVYESIFNDRYETAPWLEFTVSDFEGLCVERSDFYAEDGVTLAGYKYKKSDENIKGVVVISHGMGGGGHNTYMPFIDVFTSNGYYVFAYDVRGNDNSGGKSVEGLPQGVIDLDYALHHAVGIPEYNSLPFVLFGHSWGAYSAGNILNMHPDIKAAVLVAGFNESEDMLLYQSEKAVGSFARLTLPYVELYERIKFGKEFTEITAIDGINKSNASVLIVQSKDDTNVPTECGYSKFYEAFSDSDRVDFVLYENRGHSYLFYSDSAAAYREKLNSDYIAYVEANGGEYNAETKEKFMKSNLDKKLCFEPDAELAEKMIELYDNACKP